MLRRSPFLIILSVLGVICFVFFGLMLSPLAGKLFGSSAVSFAPAALASPTATPVPPDYWFKGAGSDPAYLEEDASDFAGVGDGETPASADQQTEPPRPSY